MSLRAFDHFCPPTTREAISRGAELRNWPGRDVTGNLVGLLCLGNPGMLAWFARMPTGIFPKLVISMGLI